MIGKTAKQANPLIRITHRQKSVALNLAKLVETLDPVNRVYFSDLLLSHSCVNVCVQSGFRVTHRQTQNFRANWIISGLSIDPMKSKISLLPLCGVRLVVAAIEK